MLINHLSKVQSFTHSPSHYLLKLVYQTIFSHEVLHLGLINQNLFPPFCLISCLIERHPETGWNFRWVIFFFNYDLYTYMTWKVDGTVPASYVFMQSPLPKVPLPWKTLASTTSLLKPIIFQSFTCCNKISHPPKNKKAKKAFLIHPWKLTLENQHFQ